jgi:hypothetical protein
MIAPDAIEVPVQRRRLAIMLAVNLICVIVAAGAAFGAFIGHVQGLIYVFAAAMVIGFAAHLWLMLGLARGAGPKGSI